MNVLALQQTVKARGYDPGPLDGLAGPRTWGSLLLYVTGGNLGPRCMEIGAAMAKQFPAFGINTRLRVAHFIAQAAHETGRFRYMEELGGPAYFAKYDGREDLGNTEPGDGARFHGRGIFQLTGRANYARYGEKLGLALVNRPEIAASPSVAVEIACRYWSDHGLNELADADDVKTITKRINGGLNGLQDRMDLLAKVKGAWPQ